MRAVNVFSAVVFMYLLLFVAVLNGFGVSEVLPPVNAQVAGAFTSLNLPTGHSAIDRINEIRIDNGVPPLKLNLDLDLVSSMRLKDMITNNYYAHIDEYGRDYSALLPVTKSFSCENLDLSSSNNEEDVIQDWLNSKTGHKECLLDPRASEVGYSIGKLNIGKNSDKSTYIAVLILSSN